MTPEFITADDFLEYWGQDLRELLRDDDNLSAKTNVFLFRVERRLMAWIDKNTFRVVSFYNLTPYQLKNWRYALLEQAMYMWRNGDIGQDSGYDQERGQIAHQSMLDEITVCRPALNFLVICGLYNQKIQNRRRFLSGDAMGLIETPKQRDASAGYITREEPAKQPIATENVLGGIGFTED